MQQVKLLNLSDVGQRLSFIRKSKGLNQKEFAKKIGVALNTLSNYERGIQNMSVETAAKICNILDVSTDFFIFGKDLQQDRTHRLQAARDNVAVTTRVVGGRLETTISTLIIPELEGL